MYREDDRRYPTRDDLDRRDEAERRNRMKDEIDDRDGRRRDGRRDRPEDLRVKDAKAYEMRYARDTDYRDNRRRRDDRRRHYDDFDSRDPYRRDYYEDNYSRRCGLTLFIKSSYNHLANNLILFFVCHFYMYYYLTEELLFVSRKFH